MKASVRKVLSPDWKYPDVTNGSKWAAEIRKEASLVSDEKRAEIIRVGMARVYGASKQAVRTGR